MHFSILIVDDVLDNIQVAMNILREDGYDFSYAKNGKEALDLLKTKHFDLILMDIMMPEMDGFEVTKKIQEDPRLMDIPIIFLTAKADIDSLSKGFKSGGVDYITKPFHPEELLARTKTHLELYQAKKLLKGNNIALSHKLEEEKRRVYTELEHTQRDIILMLAEMIESVSDETGKHVQRVSEYSYLLAKHHPSLGEVEAEEIYLSAPLHDIGKLTIPPEILHKPGRLTEEEFETMKLHTVNAHKHLKKFNRRLLKAADIIAYQHHEKWDGTGYPQGLKGTDIHIYGRIVAIADVFDALTHERQYKAAWSIDEAVNYIIERSGKQFDPELVTIFQEHLDEFIEIAKR